MKIGVDATSLHGTRGPARYAREMLKVLSICGHGDTFILYSPYETYTKELGPNLTERRVPLVKGISWLNVSLPMAVKRDRPDVMFFPANDCWLWPHARTVVALLDVAPATVLRDLQASLLDRVQNRLQMRMIPRVANRVITISEYSAKEIRSHLPALRDRISVIYCGLSEAFKKAPGWRPGNKAYILYVGGFDRRKNLENLLVAYKMLADQGRREKLLLAGSGGSNRKLYYDMPRLIKSMGLEGRATIEGISSDEHLVRLYSGARMLVMPSIIEGFGLPVLEAMACGCPVACSKAASLPEVAGEAAVYFDPGDTKNMAVAMALILDDTRLSGTISKKGILRSQKFSWATAGKKTYGLLRALTVEADC